VGEWVAGGDFLLITFCRLTSELCDGKVAIRNHLPFVLKGKELFAAADM
jgi:hypothetical protein